MSKQPPEPLYVLRGTQQPISSLDFIHPKQGNEALKYLASGTQEGLISVWDLKVSY